MGMLVLRGGGGGRQILSMNSIRVDLLLELTLSRKNKFMNSTLWKYVLPTLAAYMKDFISTEQRGHSSSVLFSDKLENTTRLSYIINTVLTLHL